MLVQGRREVRVGKTRGLRPSALKRPPDPKNSCKATPPARDSDAGDSETRPRNGSGIAAPERR